LHTAAPPATRSGCRTKRAHSRPTVSIVTTSSSAVSVSSSNADLFVAAYDLAIVEGELRAALCDCRVGQLREEGRGLSARDMADVMATALDELLS
jgi:hypothetical protein